MKYSKISEKVLAIKSWLPSHTILQIEYFSSKHRNWPLCFSHTIGKFYEMLLVVTALATRTRAGVHVGIAFLATCALPLFYIHIPESCRWLVSNSRVNKAQEIVVVRFCWFLILPGDGNMVTVIFQTSWDAFYKNTRKANHSIFGQGLGSLLCLSFEVLNPSYSFSLNRLLTHLLRNQTYYALIISDWILLAQVSELGRLFETHLDKSLWDVVGCCGHVHKNPCRSPPRHCLSGVL